MDDNRDMVSAWRRRGKKKTGRFSQKDLTQRRKETEYYSIGATAAALGAVGTRLSFIVRQINFSISSALRLCMSFLTPIRS
jgi:hypothetical protein